MAKFRVKPFKKWLDVLAAIIVKTRDDFTCQITHDSECTGGMSPLDENCQWCHIKSRNSNATRWEQLNAITGCGHCHAWAHANPVEFGIWFNTKYPHRKDAIEYLEILNRRKTWRKCDFELIESVLLQKAMNLNVDYMHVNTAYRLRFKRKIEEMKQ